MSSSGVGLEHRCHELDLAEALDDVLQHCALGSVLGHQALAGTDQRGPSTGHPQRCPRRSYCGSWFRAGLVVKEQCRCPTGRDRRLPSPRQ